MSDKPEYHYDPPPSILWNQRPAVTLAGFIASNTPWIIGWIPFDDERKDAPDEPSPDTR